jgi:SAM-dependent methyltransferase
VDVVRSPLLSAIPARDFAGESIPEGGDMRVFDVEPALRINEARRNAIEALGLDLDRKRVLDAGSGPGHFVSMYTSRGCQVTALDGRADIVDECRRRHPEVHCVAGDVQTSDLVTLGRFDIVHCLGLLYHLESPVAALRNIVRVCDGLLILESIITDAAGTIMGLDDEPKTVNQAVGGLGCRPTPSFIALVLNRIGFRHVYGFAEPPRHEDFRFEPRLDGAWQRDGHPLRAMFVASHLPLTRPALIPLVI